VALPEDALALAAPALAELADVVAAQPAAQTRWSAREPYASRSSRPFARVLARLGVGLVVTSTTAGQRILIRERAGRVNTDSSDLTKDVQVATRSAARDGDASVWFVDPGDGTLRDDSGDVVAELPGSPVALALHDGLAFVALSQRRGADLPIT